MPYYNFHCKDCGARGDFYTTYHEIARGIKVVCAICHSQNIESNIPSKNDAEVKAELQKEKCNCRTIWI